jgi:membrane-bound lytic murein transglycosylase B
MAPLIRHLCAALGLLCLALSPSPAAADAAFTQWLAMLWPQAQQNGVSRPTFDLATRGLEPDLSLPDLDLPGKPGAATPGQAEFVQTPADYI